MACKHNTRGVKPPHLDPKSPFYSAFRDPESPKFIPNAPENRASADPNKADIDGPPYRIDAEAISFSKVDTIEAVEWCLDTLDREGFNLYYPCHYCAEWKPSDRVRPERPGAKHPESSCNGCFFTFINGSRAKFRTNDRDLAFNAWAAVKREIIELEFSRKDAKGKRARDAVKKKLEAAHRNLRRAVANCRILGFNPAIAMASHRVADRTAHVVETRIENCESCRSWTYDEVISKRKHRGYCWDRDGQKTSADYWCRRYLADTEKAKSLELKKIL